MTPRTETITAKGTSIPRLGLGTWQLQGTACIQRVVDALAMGYRHIDTAQMYGNHREVGAGIRRSDVDRNEVFLTTKLWLESLEPRDVHRTVEASLHELDTPYVDLLLIHWPNPDVPLNATLEAMWRLRGEGRVRAIGVSNFPPSWVERAIKYAPIVCDQVEYHAYLSQDHLLQQLRGHDMGLIAYSPLAHGELLGDQTLREIGREHGKTAAQVALRWLLQQPGVAVVPKASTRAHLEQNFDVFDFTLHDAQMKRIRQLADRNLRTADPSFAPDWER